mgnify:CR=1 FL=1
MKNWMGPLVLLALVACGTKEEPAPTDAGDADTDTDADSDTDADADADTDADTDTDTGTFDRFVVFPTGDYDCYAEIDDDEDEDGSIDNVSLWAVDPEKRTLYRGTDYDIIGIDTQYWYERDAEGRVLLFEWDQDGNEVIDVRETTTYDADGNVLVYTEDDDADGTPEYTETNTYTADGLLETVTLEEPGVPTITITYTFDAERRRATFEEDNDGDGLTDRSAVYVSYDADGNWLQVDEDSDNDGTVDLVYQQAFDQEGRRVSSELRQTDGTLVSSDLITWIDANDSYDYEADQDGDGVVDYLQEVRYDELGQLLNYWYDEGADGIREYDVTYEWHPEGYGDTVVDYTVYTEGYGYADGRTETTYGSDGREATERWTYDTDDFSIVSLETFSWVCP